MKEVIENLLCFTFFLGIPMLCLRGGYEFGKEAYYDKGREEGISMSSKQVEDYLRNRYKKELHVLESAGFVLRKRGE